MKAWLVKEKDGECATVVFAETRGKARALAMATDACEDADFCDIEVRREPSIDKYYKEGKKEMDWENPKDRVALVKDCGFSCADAEPYWCDDCPAKKFCDTYFEYLDYMNECEELEEQQ